MEKFRLDGDFRLSNATQCPHCKAHTDAALGEAKTGGPTAGCINICVCCAGLSIFNSDLTLRVMTEEERKGIENDSKVSLLISSVKNVIREKEERLKAERASVGCWR